MADIKKLTPFMIKKRIIASATLLLPIAVTLVILSSCKDNFTDHMEAKLEIILVSGNKSEPLTDACVKYKLEKLTLKKENYGFWKLLKICEPTKYSIYN